MNTLTSQELRVLLEDAPHEIDLIDVRGGGEYDEVRISQAKNIPLHLLPLRINELDQKKKIVFICRSGGRSSQAMIYAENMGITGYNLLGGMNEFDRLYPSQVVRGKVK